MNFQKLLLHHRCSPKLLAANLGIEREAQRITLAGQLAQTDHPKGFGSRAGQPFIQTDFAETQLELVTPKVNSTAQLLSWLAAIHEVTLKTMSGSETLWPLSMPPKLPASEKDIVIAKLKDPKAIAYRQYIGQVYGRRKQMISGIHYNIEFCPELVTAMYHEQTAIDDLAGFKTALYFKVARNYLRYQWLITYLFGSATTSEAHFFSAGQGPKEPVRSLRTSHYGYTNHGDIFVSYENIDRYLADLDRLVTTGKLSAKKEFYAPVRLRGGHEVADLTTTDIQYMELRNIDINPFEAVGITAMQVDFLKLFLLYTLWAEEEQPADAWVKVGRQKNDVVALENPKTQTAYKQEGLQVLAAMKIMAQTLGLKPAALALIALAEDRLKKPAQTLAGQWCTAIEATSQAELASKIALSNRQSFCKLANLSGFENRTPHTQQQLFQAILAGQEETALELAATSGWHDLKQVD